MDRQPDIVIPLRPHELTLLIDLLELNINLMEATGLAMWKKDSMINPREFLTKLKVYQTYAANTGNNKLN